MVVIAIIAVLAAILIPTLGHVKTKARETATLTLISNLSSAIDSYYTTFHYYPGPAALALTATPATKKLSGAQNLLLGLSYRTVQNSWFGPPPKHDGANAANYIQIGTSGYYTDPTHAAGPINGLVVRPDGDFEQLAPYFSPSNNQISTQVGTTWPNSGITNTIPGSNTFAFPVIMDAYPDALPILYFRRTPGVDFVPGTSPHALAALNPTATPSAPYYLNENSEYLTGSLTSGNATVINQSDTGVTPFSVADLQSLVQTDTTTSSLAHGGYLLMSAGSDRYYGRLNGNLDNVSKVGGN
jgi:type II secretory pathway pseudopilin PulG